MRRLTSLEALDGRQATESRPSWPVSFTKNGRQRRNDVAVRRATTTSIQVCSALPINLIPNAPTMKRIPVESDPQPLNIGYIITRNEEETIGRAVSSLSRVSQAVLVVDSESTDRTVQIALTLGAIAITHPFEGFAAQRNWALDEIRKRFGEDTWVTTLDADEWLSEPLEAEIQKFFDSTGVRRVEALLVKRQAYFAGRLLRYGVSRGSLLPRIFKIGAGDYGDREINEHLVLRPGGRVETLTAPILHDDVHDWSEYIEKLDKYSTLEAMSRVSQPPPEHRLSLRTAIQQPHLRRRWVIENVWPRVPAKPIIRFLHALVLSGGFLDGSSGMHKAVFIAWQESITGLKASKLREQTGKR
jgi:hypothetical protein